jgi:hypothetical protein
MNFSKRRKRRAGILPASFVAAGWEPALLFQFAILALAITWTRARCAILFRTIDNGPGEDRGDHGPAAVTRCVTTEKVTVDLK